MITCDWPSIRRTLFEQVRWRHKPGWKETIYAERSEYALTITCSTQNIETSPPSQIFRYTTAVDSVESQLLLRIGRHLDDARASRT